MPTGENSPAIQKLPLTHLVNPYLDIRNGSRKPSESSARNLNRDSNRCRFCRHNVKPLPAGRHRGLRRPKIEKSMSQETHGSAITLGSGRFTTPPRVQRHSAETLAKRRQLIVQDGPRRITDEAGDSLQ